LLGLTLGAFLPRAYAADVLISREGYTLDTLPHGAKIGTCSASRSAQLRHLRPDLQPIDIRGNIDHRIQQAYAPDSPYNAIVLAHAGLARLGRLEVVSDTLRIEDLVPAPGQAALGIQCRDEALWRDLLQPVNHLPTEIAVTAERAFMAELGGGWDRPVAAFAVRQRVELRMLGRVTSPDGRDQRDFTVMAGCARVDDARRIGIELAAMAQEQGALAMMGITTG
jgi:hydroxymethylbilane synthase